MTGEDDEGGGVDNLAIEKEAKTMGWIPEEQFKGSKDHWVSAEEFVEKGRAVMPILVANNKRLQADRLTMDTKIGTLELKLTDATVALSKLEKHYIEANKRSVEQARKDLLAELKVAREDDDVEGEEAIRDKLDALRKSTTEPAKPAPVVKTEETLSPEFLEWQDENPWFLTDKKRAKALIRISEDLREDGDTSTGRPFMDACMDRLLETEGGDSEVSRPTSKVEVNGSRGNSRPTGKSFADLPRDAKEACWDDVDDLVGPDKIYKTKADWEKGYAKIYWGMA